MTQKAQWIAGDASTEKSAWYQALQDHESAFGDLRPASMQHETVALLRSFPVGTWRNARLRNLAHLLGAIDRRTPATILPGTHGLPLIAPSREAAVTIRQYLVSQGIYPATIWPQPDDGSRQDLDLASRMLMLHTDLRYGEAEMEEVARALDSALTKGGHD